MIACAMQQHRNTHVCMLPSSTLLLLLRLMVALHPCTWLFCLPVSSHNATLHDVQHSPTSSQILMYHTAARTFLLRIQMLPLNDVHNQCCWLATPDSTSFMRAVSNIKNLADCAALCACAGAPPGCPQHPGPFRADWKSYCNSLHSSCQWCSCSRALCCPCCEWLVKP